VLDRVDLCLSELVTSFVTCTDVPEVAVTVSVTGPEARVAVVDGRVDVAPLDGMAMRVVQSTADRWGAQLEDDTAMLWFTVRAD